MKLTSRTLGCILLGLMAVILGGIPASAAQYAYVTNYGSNSVSVIDRVTKTVVATVTVGANPAGIALTPDGAFAYVGSYGSGKVFVIATASNTVVATVPVASAVSIAITPNGAFAYVTTRESNTVSVIATATNTVVATIPVGSVPIGIAITPDGVFAYVTAQGSGSNIVSVIATATNTVVATVTVGMQPWGVAFTPDGAFAYVANGGSATVSVIATATNTVVATVPVGVNPVGVALTPNGSFAYVASMNSNIVSVINTANHTVVATIPVGGGPHGVGITPDGAFAYVTLNGSNLVSVIDTATNTVVTTVTVGSSPIWVAFTPSLPSQFVPVTPCRLWDTRTFRDPIQGGTAQSFGVPELGCNIPTSATAYSLNVTVVPHGPLGYLTIWPTEENQPAVSTLNSLDGRIKADAAIVPAGYQGAVSVYATDTTDVVLDIDGYFAPPSSSTMAFYPLTPCRVVDTRLDTFPAGLGSPQLSARTPRDFPVLSSSCIPSGVNPGAYSFNFTVVPGSHQVGYLSVWPTGQSRPVVSTLNDHTGTIVANAAIVPAGSGGEISVYSTDNTQLLVDINGYFAAPGAGGLSLYPASPCRVLDTRQIGDRQPFSTAESAG